MSALIRITFPSTALLRPVEIFAALPMPNKTLPATGHVLWALHCAMEDGDYFFRYLDGLRISQHTGVAIIAPSLANGFFMNTSYEAQGDFLEELADALPGILHISSDRSRNAVLGISMGGFGAMRWALQTRRFFAAAAISGAFDATLPVDKRVESDRHLNGIRQAFDEMMRKRISDPAGHLPGKGNLRKLVETHDCDWPWLYFYCGAEDYLSLEQNDKFYELCKSCGAPAHLYLNKGGHDLHFWRKAFPLAIKEIFQIQNF